MAWYIDVILRLLIIAVLHYASTYLGRCSTVSDKCCNWQFKGTLITNNSPQITLPTLLNGVIIEIAMQKQKKSFTGVARTRWRVSRDKDYELTQRWHHQQNEHIKNQREWLCGTLFIYQDHGSEVLSSVLQIKRHV